MQEEEEDMARNINNIAVAIMQYKRNKIARNKNKKIINCAKRINHSACIIL